MSIKVVTDSTADLPVDIVNELEIKVVPLNVHFGEDVYRDGVELSAKEFMDRLVSGIDMPSRIGGSLADKVLTISWSMIAEKSLRQNVTSSKNSGASPIRATRSNRPSISMVPPVRITGIPTSASMACT